MRKDKLHQDLSVFNFAVTYFVLAQYHFLLLVKNGAHNTSSLRGEMTTFQAQGNGCSQLPGCYFTFGYF